MKNYLVFFFSFYFLSLGAQDWKVLSHDLPDIINSGWDIDQSSNINNDRRNILLISQATIYTVSLVGLNKLWYANYPKSNFHFINDNHEWLQMDKVGHLTTSYYIGVAGIKAYKWTGMKRKKAIWYGGLMGSFFLSIIEVLDGKSQQWGASSGDFFANTSGSLFAIFQELKWDEQRISLKYSYSPSKWAKFNPNQLGSNHFERALKDYNGQTYWLSFNLKSLLSIKSGEFPRWLNLAIGYSGDKMITAYQEEGDEIRERQYLLSLDIDLSRIKTKSKSWNSVIHTFGFIKFPMPTLELSGGSLLAHPIYF